MHLEFFIYMGLIYFISITLYKKIYIFKKFLIQPSIIAGMIFLFLGPQFIDILNEKTFSILKQLPGIFISFVFSGMILNNPKIRITNQKYFLAILRQANFVWLIALSQLLVGCILAYLLFSDPQQQIIASIIEMGWIGGHGSASAFSVIAKDFQNPIAGDLALISATIGLLWGTLSGLILVYITKKRIYQNQENNNQWKYVDSNSISHSKWKFPRIISSIIYGMIFISIPVLLAYKIKTYIEIYWTWLQSLPLFFFVILIAFLVRFLFSHLWSIFSSDEIQSGIKISTNIVLEILILSAIGSMNIILAFQHGKILILFSLGGILTSLFLFLIAPYFIDFHPEISLINYGMSTGTTAVGFMLLKSYTNKKEFPDIPVFIYGSAAPFSAPFIGGGTLSFLVPYIIIEGNIKLIIFFIIILIVGIIGLNFLFLKPLTQSKVRS